MKAGSSAAGPGEPSRVGSGEKPEGLRVGRPGRPAEVGAMSDPSNLGLSLTQGMLDLRGARVVVMTEAAYILLLQIIHEHAPHILKYAFYDMGYRAGVDIMAGLADRRDDIETTFRHFIEQYEQAGYGEIDVTSFDAEASEVHLSGRNLFEAGLAPKTGIYRSPRAVDHYSRGMFAGFLSALFDRQVVCEEVACAFRGEPRCEFVVLPFQQ